MAGKFYRISGLFYLAGLSWLMSTLLYQPESDFTFCLFKNVTSIPCPACGTGRGLQAILKADFLVAVQSNPIAFLWIVAFLIYPLWFLYDAITHKKSLYKVYLNGLSFVNKPTIYLPLIALILANWAWNIIKMI